MIRNFIKEIKRENNGDTRTYMVYGDGIGDQEKLESSAGKIALLDYISYCEYQVQCAKELLLRDYPELVK